MGAMLVKKWHTLIEAHTKVKTTDGYVLRIFALVFTKRRPEQTKATCYAGSGQVRRIRKKMVEIMQKEANKSQLRELVKKLIPRRSARRSRRRRAPSSRSRTA